MSGTHANDKASTATLYMALELSAKTWLIAFHDGSARKPRHSTIDAGELTTLMSEISRAKERFGLSTASRILSCYEAGRDGFWIHRALEARGLENHVLDSSSIEVNRRARRAKTDKLDAEALLRILVRFDRGDREACRVVRVPSESDEEARGAHRERQRLKAERLALRNRAHGLLATQGLHCSMGQLTRLLNAGRTRDGRELGPRLVGELRRILERWQLATEQLNALEAEQRRAVKSEEPSSSIVKVAQLMKLNGIGLQGAWLLVMEFFAWRRFRNRKEVAALAGLTPTPWSSGAGSRQQGISKAGNKRVRTLMIELALLWLRHQPESALTKWFHQNYSGAKRSRKSGIVALARKLLIALWHFVEHGVIPDGAKTSTPRLLKTAGTRRHGARTSTRLEGVDACAAPALLAG